MWRQCATTTAQTGDGSDHGERTHPKAPPPIDAKPTQRGGKQTGKERKRMTLQHTLSGSPEPKKGKVVNISRFEEKIMGNEVKTRVKLASQ